MNIGILGAGAWAIGLASLLHQRGHGICLWEFNARDAEQLRKLREHPLKLPGVFLSESIVVTNDCVETLGYGPVVVVAVPAQFLRGALKHVVATSAPQTRRAIEAWVIVTKGIENGSGALMTDVMAEEIPELEESRLVVLSGPSLAAEVARHVPTTVVAASKDKGRAKMVQREFSTESFRIYTNDDVRGVELAGSTKNVMAVAAGICDGLGLGNNTKGALLTRGLVEMTRLGCRLGAREETFFGLAGMGDLVTTCVSTQSRNHKFGELVGSGLSMQEALKQMVMVAEGVETARAVHDLGKKLGIDLPIAEQVYLTLFEGKPAREAVRDLMAREQKAER